MSFRLNVLRHMNRFRLLAGLGVVGVTSVSGVAFYVSKTAHEQNDNIPVSYIGTEGTEAACQEDDDDMVLRAAQVFFRHGARTPLRHLPKAVGEVSYDGNYLDRVLPHTDIPICITGLDGEERPSAWLDNRYRTKRFAGGMSAGVLTTVGQDQAYVLGCKLRQRYIDDLGLLRNTYNKEDVFIRSTNVNRCIDSLRCLLAGMYHRSTFQDSAPVIIPVAKKRDEVLFPNINSCEMLGIFNKRYKDSQKLDSELSGIVEKINSIIEHDGWLEMMVWRDHIRARQVHGLPVPKFLEDMQKEIDENAVRVLEYNMAGTPEDRDKAIKVSAGPMLHIIDTNFDNIVNHCDKKKLFLYSCHDSSIVPLLLGLNGFDKKWPDYTADVSLELWQSRKDEQYWVRMTYCSEPLVPEGYDSHFIPYTKFKELIVANAVDETTYSNLCSKDVVKMRELADDDDEKMLDNM